MSQYDDTNRGALFKNDRKESDKHPDYKGPLNINGTDGWIAAWLKTDKNGKKYMSLSWEPKQQSHAADPAQQGPQAKSQGYEDPSDEVPF